MSYIDGFVAAVPTAGEQAYLEHARLAAGLFREFGATRSVECWGDDVKDGHTTDFRRAVQAKDDETVVFAWIEYPDKPTRDAAMARIMEDPRMRDTPMPFDGRRMIFGGFAPLVDEGPIGAGYVDGYLVPVPEGKRDAYRDVALSVLDVFREHGVARLVEGWGDDVPAGEVTDFYRAVKAEPGENVVFSWCEYPDRDARDAAQAGMMADERMKEPPADMPFDGKRMVMGGFRVILDEGDIRMNRQHGMPIWYELMTGDPDAAQAFYAEVVGWDVAPFPGGAPDQDYRILATPEGQGVGGLMKAPDAGMPPGWLCYIGVDDVDAIAARIGEFGGQVHVPPTDIPGVGRFAFAADPQGLMFYVMRGDSPESSGAFSETTVGHAAWNELVTTDHKAGLAFYGALFGWENTENMPMGEMGDYAFIDSHGTRIGATMTAQPGWPTRWNCYFRVASIAEAADKVARAGGQVDQGPMEVPGGDHILMGTDPQGASFALVGGR